MKIKQIYTTRPKTVPFRTRICCGRFSIPPLGTPEAYSPGGLHFSIICILVFLSTAIMAYGQQGNWRRQLIVFYSPSCHNCSEAKSKILPEIEKKFKDKIQIEYRDIDDIENYKFLLALQKKYGVTIKNTLPVFYFEGNFINGQGRIKEQLASLIQRVLSLPVKAAPDLQSIDLVERFKSFEPLAVVSAGLVDGINPCAFTVIVFFISFLALQGYRKRELVVIGLFFILAVFLTYLLIGLGIFGFLYRMANFWLVTRIFNFSIGIFSLVLGVLAVYDFFKFKKTNKTEGLILQLPTAVKNQIHTVIGLQHRKSGDTQTKNAPNKLMFRLVASALVTGFLVSILEAICTGQMYLPTITFIFKTSPLKLEALGYLALYNLMFITPLFAIFILALLGTTSEEFSRFLKKHLLTVKLLMAVLFFSLGAFLIWKG